jgi:acyl-CoA thioester hydrolase
MSEKNNLDRIRQVSRDEFRFFIPMPTRWGDSDLNGHINNAMFVRYLESGRLDYYAEVFDKGFDQSSPPEFILASLQIDYLKQVNHPAELTIGTRVSSLGNSSFESDGAIFLADEEAPVVISRSVCVWFNYDNNRSERIPQAARDAVDNYERVKPL